VRFAIGFHLLKLLLAIREVIQARAIFAVRFIPVRVTPPEARQVFRKTAFRAGFH
jgi:hypothetical protein